MASGPVTSWQIDGETTETVTDYFLGLQNYCRCEIKRHLHLGRKVMTSLDSIPAPVLFPGKSHGQRSMVGYSPWGS